MSHVGLLDIPQPSINLIRCFHSNSALKPNVSSRQGSRDAVFNERLFHEVGIQTNRARLLIKPHCYTSRLLTCSAHKDSRCSSRITTYPRDVALKDGLLSSLTLMVQLPPYEPFHFKWRAALFESLSPLSASAYEDLFRVISEDTSSCRIENNFLKWKARASHVHYSVVTELISYLIYINHSTSMYWTLFICILFALMCRCAGICHSNRQTES